MRNIRKPDTITLMNPVKATLRHTHTREVPLNSRAHPCIVSRMKWPLLLRVQRGFAVNCMSMIQPLQKYPKIRRRVRYGEHFWRQNLQMSKRPLPLSRKAPSLVCSILPTLLPVAVHFTATTFLLCTHAKANAATSSKSPFLYPTPTKTQPLHRQVSNNPPVLSFIPNSACPSAWKEPAIRHSKKALSETCCVPANFVVFIADTRVSPVYEIHAWIIHNGCR